MSDVKSGVVKKKMDKGFGFISVDGQAGEKDLFFHMNSLVGKDDDEKQAIFNALQDEDKNPGHGTRVSFEVATDSPKGPNAVNVQKVN